VEHLTLEQARVLEVEHQLRALVRLGMELAEASLELAASSNSKVATTSANFAKPTKASSEISSPGKNSGSSPNK